MKTIKLIDSNQHNENIAIRIKPDMFEYVIYDNIESVFDMDVLDQVIFKFYDGKVYPCYIISIEMKLDRYATLILKEKTK